MRIIETFICYSASELCYVKVHRCRDDKSNNVYFIELKGGSLNILTDKESNVLLTNHI